MGIYVTIEGKENGPYVEEEARHFFNTGDFLAEDLARREGETELRPLGELLAQSNPSPATIEAPKPSPAANIYISVQGEEHGPYDDAEVRHYLKSGDFLLKDLARRQGQTKLQPLAALLAAATHSPTPAQTKPRLLPNGRAAPVPWVEPEQTGPSGIGGWLLLFCVLNSIIAPIFIVISIIDLLTNSREFLAAFPALKSSLYLTVIIDVILMVAGVCVGVTIWSGHAKGRTIARAFLVFKLLLVVVGNIICLAMASPMHPKAREVFSEHIVRGIILSVANITLWWYYFSNSVRVANTYGPE